MSLPGPIGAAYSGWSATGTAFRGVTGMEAGLVSRARRPLTRFSSVVVVVTLGIAGAIGLSAASAVPALASLCTNTAPITLGDPAIAGSITDVAQGDCYTFDGIVGDRVHVAVNATSGTLVPSTEVVDPSFAQVCGPTTDAEQVCQLTSSGSYTIIIRDSTDTETGDYTVSADSLHPACTDTNPIVVGDPATTGSISAEGQADCYTFDGVVGDRVHISVAATDGTLVPNTSVVDPSDAVTCGPTTDAEQTCQLASSGTHTILIRDAASTGTGGYTVAAVALHAGCTNMSPIGLGAAASTGSISAAGQADCYTYSGAIGDRVHITVVATNGTLVPNTSVIDPTDAVTCGPTTDAEQTCRVTTDGTHIIVIGDVAETGTGGYTVAADLIAPTCADTVPIKLGDTSLTGSVSSSDEAHCYTFPAKVNDRMRVRVVATDGTVEPFTTILNPGGSAVCGPTTQIEQTCRITSTGTHTIMVRDHVGTNTGGYTVYLQRLAIPKRCTVIAFGATALSGSITVPGDADCYTFRAPTGLRVRIRVVATAGAIVPSTELINVNGATLCGPSTAIEQTCRLFSSRNNMILVRDDAGPNLGDYSIYVQINHALSCTPIRIAAPPTAGAITVPGNADCYTFKGVSGDRMRIRVVGLDGTLVPYTDLINSIGVTICGPSSAIEQTCRITNPGTHVIMIRDMAGPGTGNYVVYLQRLDLPLKCSVLTVGAPAVAGTIGVAGETDCFSVDGVAGHKLRFEVIGTDGTLVANTEVLNPNGTTLLGPSTAVDQDVRLTATGTHTILVRDLTGTGTGGYTVAVIAI